MKKQEAADQVDFAKLKLELAKIAMTRAEKQEANLDTETKESAKLARPDDEDAPKPKNEAEAKKELDLLKANAKALKGDLAAAAETAASLAAAAEDKELKPEKRIAAETKAALADLDV